MQGLACRSHEARGKTQKSYAEIAESTEFAEKRRARGTVTQRSQRKEHRGHREDKCGRGIPPLRGPTGQKPARKKKSGPALRDRDDKTGKDKPKTQVENRTWGTQAQDPGTHSVPVAPGVEKGESGSLALLGMTI